MDILQNKEYKSFDYISRYAPFPAYYHSLDDKYIVGTDNWLSDKTIYQTHIVKSGDTYDLLALRYYNNPTYYWIICAFNRILDPFELPNPGTQLKIPSISNLEYIDRG